jgi:hypothetical protein
MKGEMKLLKTDQDKGKAVTVTKHHVTESYGGRGHKAPRILGIVNTWIWKIVSLYGRFT